MSHEPDVPTVDLIRWTFRIDPARRAEVADYLADLGLDVQDRGDGRFVVTWDEPEGDPGHLEHGPLHAARIGTGAPPARVNPRWKRPPAGRRGRSGPGSGRARP